MQYTFKTFSRQLLADTLTPVNIYLKLRDIFAASILLESSDYHGQENSLSFICCDPIGSFEATQNAINIEWPDGRREKQAADSGLVSAFEKFQQSFVDDSRVDSKYIHFGFFGYTSYDAVQFFEDVSVKTDEAIPLLQYKFYRYVIVIDHFSNELTLFEHAESSVEESSLDKLVQVIYSHRISNYPFHLLGSEEANVTDLEFLEMVEKGKQHCYRGDVFQIVLSRRFKSKFQGDEFNVYRALRSVNPSPYLFYFDLGNFKLMGSSPEAQLQIKSGKASIYPIAGTFRRTGNDPDDLALAEQLAADEKENAEHVMLVDLARNDMSRNAEQVNVEVFKEVQFYSHVIHLVSKVSGTLHKGTTAVRMAADTFPAGTLSGAPKHKAITLINQIERGPRGFYGGAIGYLGVDGSYNHAIMIRTFLSYKNQLLYQAGAGVVAKSEAQSELQEVNNKLGALRKALKMAEQL